MKRLQELLTALFNIRPGEERPTLLLLIHSFFMGLALVFFETTAYALFLDRFSADRLPYIYIGSAFVIAFFGYIYSRLESRLRFDRLLPVTVFFFFLSIVGIYLLLKMTIAPWILSFIVIWHNLMVAMVGLQFWALAGYLMNARQGKRLFGLISAGEIVAGIISGFSISLLLETLKIPTLDLFLFSGAGMAACLIVLIHILRVFRTELTPEEGIEEDVRNESLPKSRYLILVLSFAALSVFGYYLLDFIFYNRVDFRFSGESEIASFLGIFFGIMGIVNLFSNAFLPGRVITRYGLNFGLLAVSITVLTGAILSGVFTIFTSQNGAFFFWIIIGTKLLDEVLRNSIEEPSLRILYQPFPTGQRLKAQTLLETMVEPLAGAAAGAILLGLTLLLGFGAVHIALFIILICGGWITLAILVRKEYLKVLMNALTRRKLGGKALSLSDSTSEDVLKRGLQNPDPGVVIYCLNMLEEIEHDRVDEYMRQLLGHPSPQIRSHVLERMAALEMSDAGDAIHRHLKKERVPEVQGIAIKALCAATESDAFDEVYPYLDHSDSAVKKGAMVGLLKSGGIDGVLSAGANLNRLIASERPVDRKMAAEILGEVGISGFYRPLLELLEDSDPQVRKAAIVAAGRLKSHRLLPNLMNHFSSPTFRKYAISSVISYGSSILPELEETLDQEGQSREIRIRIIRIMGRIGGKEAIDILKKKIDFSDEDLRNQILASLVKCRYRAPKKEIPLLGRRIESEVSDATWTLTAILDFGDHQTSTELVDALRQEVENNRKRIFLLLAMIYPSDTILSAQADIATPVKNKRDRAIEMLENLIDPEIKQIVLPLLDDLSPAQRHSRLIAHFEQQRMSAHERLKEILSRSQQWTSIWTKACALYTVGRIGTSEFHDAVISCLSEPDPTVRETAIWALGCLNPNDLPQRLQPLTRDKNERVAKFARFVINSVGFASIPMSKGYLTRSGRYTVELFKNVLLDEGERRARRCRAASILARFPGDTARAALFEGLTISDKTIRTGVLDALIQGNFTLEGESRQEFSKLLHMEINDAKRILASIVTLLNARHSERLVHALSQEISHTRQRILSILCLLGGVPSEFQTYNYWYLNQEDKPIPQTMNQKLQELLGLIPDQKIRQRIFHLFQYRDLTEYRKIRKIRELTTRESLEKHLRGIAFGSSIFTLSWSRICAMEMIVRLNFTNCATEMAERLEDRDDIVRATAAWALHNLDPESYASHAIRLKNDTSYLVAKTARQLEDEEKVTKRNYAHAADH